MNNFASKFKKSKKPKIERLEKYKKPKIKNMAHLQQIENIHLGDKLVTQNVTDYPDLPIGSFACIRSQTTTKNHVNTFYNQRLIVQEPERFDKDGNLNLYFVLGNDVKQFISESDLRKMSSPYQLTLSMLNAYCACLFNGEIIPVRKTSLVVKKQI